MNSRERVFMAIAHEQPDRPPISATFTPEIAKVLRSECGIESEDLGVILGNDLVKTTVGMENSYYMTDDPVYTCPFGVTWRNITNHTGSYTEIIGGALHNDHGEKLTSYEIPNPNDPTLYIPIKEAVSKYGKEKFIVGSCQCSLFETAWYLRGMEDFLADMLIDEDYTNAILDKIMQFPLNAGLNMIESGADMIWLGDDVATQTNMIMSIDTWRMYFKPRYAAMFDRFKKLRKDIVIAYHSCGNCEAIIEDMVEIGLNVLNPIQPLAMDPYKIKQRYGKQITLFGAIDVQQLMPFGTTEEIISVVREYKKYLGAGGGYILSPAHHIQSDTSLENILAFYDTAKEATEYNSKYL